MGSSPNPSNLIWVIPAKGACWTRTVEAAKLREFSRAELGRRRGPHGWGTPCLRVDRRPRSPEIRLPRAGPIPHRSGNARSGNARPRVLRLGPRCMDSLCAGGGRDLCRNSRGRWVRRRTGNRDCRLRVSGARVPQTHAPGHYRSAVRSAPLREPRSRLRGRDLRPLHVCVPHGGTHSNRRRGCTLIGCRSCRPYRRNSGRHSGLHGLWRSACIARNGSLASVADHGPRRCHRHRGRRRGLSSHRTGKARGPDVGDSSRRRGLHRPRHRNHSCQPLPSGFLATRVGRSRCPGSIPGRHRGRTPCNSRFFS